MRHPHAHSAQPGAFRPTPHAPRRHAAPDTRAARAEINELQQALRDLCADWPAAWFDYGDLDPLQGLGRLTWRCSCGEVPALVTEADGRYRVRCEACGAQSEKAQHPYIVVVAWNRSGASNDPPWREMPFFDIGHLSLEDALAKMQGMVDHLRLRVKMANIGWNAGIEVGRQFKMRLKAYAAWADYIHLTIQRQEGLLSMTSGSVHRRRKREAMAGRPPTSSIDHP